MRILILLLGCVLAGGLVVPVAAYMVGKRVIGAYEGKLGLTDYLGSLYAGAGSGEPLAWLLMLSPALLVLTWAFVAAASRRFT